MLGRRREQCEAGRGAGASAPEGAALETRCRLQFLRSLPEPRDLPASWGQRWPNKTKVSTVATGEQPAGL